MLSTVHFEALCRDCPKGGKFEVRGYSQPIDDELPLDALPDWQFSCMISIEGKSAHASLARGGMSRSHIRDVEARLRLLGVRSWYWERHLKDGTIRIVERRL